MENKCPQLMKVLEFYRAREAREAEEKQALQWRTEYDALKYKIEETKDHYGVVSALFFCVFTVWYCLGGVCNV